MQVPTNVTIDQFVRPIAAEGDTAQTLVAVRIFLLNFFVRCFTYISHISHIFYSCQLQEAIKMMMMQPRAKV